MNDDLRKVRVELPENDIKILTEIAKKSYNLRPQTTMLYIQQYIQEKYDSLEDKEGNITIRVPTPKELLDFIAAKTFGKLVLKESAN